MQENRFSQILNAIILFSFVIAAASLISLVVPKVYGIIIGIALIAITIFGLFTEKHFNIPQKIRDYGITLLLSIVICIGAFVSAFSVGEKFLPFFLCCSFAGFVGIIKWVVEKRWKGKSIASILADDFHLLPPSVDITIIILNILDIILGHGEFSILAIVINSILLLDIVIQTITKNRASKLTQ